MSHRRKTEMEIEQAILLGGQVSAKHKEFQTLGMLAPDLSLAWLFLNEKENLDKLDPGPEKLLKLIEILGKAKNMINYTELTRLSMILGDTRAKYSAKGLKDELAKRAAAKSNTARSG